MPVPCARCSTPLPKWELASGGEAVCYSCGSANHVRVYPALFAQPAPAEAQIAAEGDAACFDHPGKRAVAACQQCGRFVCQLCAIEMHGGSWCPTCVAAGAGAARVARAEPSRTLFDSIALTLPLASIIMWPLTVFAGPSSVVLSLLKWRQPLSLVRRSRWRFVVAILLGLAETAGWCWLILYIVLQAKNGVRK
jgi:hypothetical protein